VILLQNIVQVLRGPMPTSATECPFLLHLCNGGFVDRCQVRIDAIEKVTTPAMALATVADIMAHGTCAMMADPAAANAALQSVP
jgi:hypothetical protein